MDEDDDKPRELPPEPQTTRGKLEASIQAKICQSIEVGNYIETAAALAGISKQTLYDWLKKGERAKSGRYFEFKRAMDLALARSEERDVKRVDGAGIIDWKAAAWRLERKFPDRWGRKDRIQVDQNVRPPGDVDYSKLSLEELKVIDELHKKAKAGDDGP